MKVCFLTSNYAPEVWAGTEQVLFGLSAALRARGVEVVVITGSELPHAGTDVRTDEVEGIVVHRVSKLLTEWDRTGFVRPRVLAVVRQLLLQVRPDLVHVHSFSSLGAGCSRLARDLGLQVMMTFHDLWVTCARYFRIPPAGMRCPTGASRQGCVECVNDALQTDVAAVTSLLAERDAALRAEVALASVCTAPSVTAARLIADYLPYAGEIHVVPHGLVRAVAAAERAMPPRSDELLRIGTFGGLVAEKGVRELVSAVAGLPCELHLAGLFHEPAFAAEMRDLAHRQGTRLVEHGRFTPVDRHPARNLHLAVFPSKCAETYGLVVDEALAHGVPVVASDAGALAERACTPGVVVTPIAALAAVLRELVGSPDRLASLRAAIPDRLPNMDAAADRYIEFYRRLS